MQGLAARFRTDRLITRRLRTLTAAASLRLASLYCSVGSGPSFCCGDIGGQMLRVGRAHDGRRHVGMAEGEAHELHARETMEHIIQTGLVPQVAAFGLGLAELFGQALRDVSRRDRHAARHAAANDLPGASGGRVANWRLMLALEGGIGEPGSPTWLPLCASEFRLWEPSQGPLLAQG